MVTQVRIYTINRGMLDSWIKQFNEKIVPTSAKFGINVNGIGPGYVLTDQVRWLFDDPALKSRILAKQPGGAIGAEEDVAATALFLASDAARHINGEMIYVDGASAAGWMGPE